eukprot:TRINITY_DN33038_c0_g1_i1.p1 TRINITY_DN33038_c0_g1~~TRINITY_DN33038_c0_g1_i1.p1  ORF type:complete len:608 (+),score=59.93 TRINITY_DN33038_c0_g1_i1:17-1840(+)
MSLRRCVRQRLLEDMIGSVHGDWKILIVDKWTMPILSAACRNHDVMDKRVTLIEDLSKKRQPLPYPAIYFLAPHEESISLFLEDWTREGGKTMYSEAHLFFANRLDDILEKQLSVVGTYIKTFSDINLDFLCPEYQVFHFDFRNDLREMFGPSKIDKLGNVASQLLTVCLTLNEYPIVRYQNSEIAPILAQKVQEKLDTYKRTVKNFEPTDQRATLLILDRTVDVMAPLLHEFTYQAMVYDLCEGTGRLVGNRYKYTAETSSGKPVDKEAILDENDPLWCEYRHGHIADVSKEVSTNFNNFLSSNKVSQAKGKGMDTKGLAEAVRAMPQYQDKISKFSLHIRVSDDLMNLYREQNLHHIALTEQNLACGGIDCEGKELSDKELRKQVEQHLKSPHVSAQNKLRLFLMYIESRGGLTEGARNELVQMAGFGPNDMAAINSLAYLDVTIEKKKQKFSFFGGKKDKKKDKKNMKQEAYEVSRYIPTVHSVIESHVQNKLSPGEFPFTAEPPSSNATSSSSGSSAPAPRSLRGPPRPKWMSSRGGSSSSDGDSERHFDGPRVIVFIAGGVTLSEVRAAQEAAKELKREVIIGSTSITTPHTFVSDMIEMGR